MDSTANQEASEERNARRRHRYQKDRVYRLQQIKLRRESTRRNQAVRERDSTTNLSNIQEHMTSRKVKYLGSIQTMNTLSIPQFAALAGYTLQVVYRWIENEQVPPPIATGVDVDFSYYTKKEAVAIVRELAKHQRTVSYYRTDHASTRHKIFEAVNKVRAGAA